ncbi:MAG TPA: NAD(P)H-dependent oxidoreductase [Steroidobacteraceae bacterium]|jgi:chromate reductase
MAESLDIVAVVGSLRRESFTRRLVQALAAMAPASLRIEIVGIGDLPLYNQDLESAPPPAWLAFRERTRRAQGVLFATPEYNRSMPGLLKNAIDVGSRPYGKSVWSRKPAGIISASPGALGAFGANHHLRQALVFLDMPAMQQPEAYIGGVDKLLDPSDQIVNPASRQFFEQFLKSFEAWVRRHAG